jgi:hypothetical protein
MKRPVQNHVKLDLRLCKYNEMGVTMQKSQHHVISLLNHNCKSYTLYSITLIDALFRCRLTFLMLKTSFRYSIST